MLTYGKLNSILYRNFEEYNEECSDVLRDILETEFDQQLFDEYIDYSAFPTKNLMLYIASVLDVDGQKKKAEWLYKKAEEKQEETAPKISVYWLNDRVESEIQLMSKSKRKNLKQTINAVIKNPELLRENHSNVGFVIQGEILRVFKKHGSDGFRVYFVLTSDGKNCVILGLSKGKSTTDVPKSEIDAFLALAKETQSSVDITILKQANVVDESYIGLYGDAQKLEDGPMVDLSERSGRILIASNLTLNESGEFTTRIAFFDPTLTIMEVQKQKEKLGDSVEFAQWLFKRIFGENQDMNQMYNFDGYVIN